MKGAAAPWQPAVGAAITQASGVPFTVREARPVAGGCMHRSFVVADGGSRYFVKTNEARLGDALAAEAEGLSAILAAGVRAPRPLCHGSDAAHAWLVMEFLELDGPPDFARMGRQLAKLHASTGEAHGWHHDNWIGATPQRNARSDDWVLFWQTQRLAPQLELAVRNGFGERLARAGDRLIAALPGILRGHGPEPSLLHGDLWGGNAGFLADGEPVVFDPAVYYGDREADLAMTELFGVFAPDFYRTYREIARLEPGYETRRTLYNLYHVLNHANLFGGGYAAQAERMMLELLAQTAR